MSKVPDSKPSSQWYEKHCFELHRKKVENMKSSMKSTLRDAGEMSMHRASPVHSARDLEVQFENIALLRKLAWISSTNSPLSEQSFPSLPMTLNSMRRKKELSRIAAENEEITRRLTNRKGCMSTKALEKDYQRMCGYKKLYKSTYVKRPEKASQE